MAKKLSLMVNMAGKSKSTPPQEIKDGIFSDKVAFEQLTIPNEKIKSQWSSGLLAIMEEGQKQPVAKIPLEFHYVRDRQVSGNHKVESAYGPFDCDLKMRFKAVTGELLPQPPSSSASSAPTGPQAPSPQSQNKTIPRTATANQNGFQQQQQPMLPPPQQLYPGNGHLGPMQPPPTMGPPMIPNGNGPFAGPGPNMMMPNQMQGGSLPPPGLPPQGMMGPPPLTHGAIGGSFHGMPPQQQFGTLGGIPPQQQHQMLGKGMMGPPPPGGMMNPPVGPMDVQGQQLRYEAQQLCHEIDGLTMCSESLKKEAVLRHASCVTLQQNFDDLSSRVEDSQSRIASLRAKLEETRNAAQEMRQLRIEMESMKSAAASKSRGCSCSIM
eukprot:PhF_6_TR32985/c0_g1_i1/m.48586